MFKVKENKEKLNIKERSKRFERLHLLKQGGFFLLTNGHLSGFFSGKIYQGPLKQVCVPGLNCYSCPGALGACPMGSLQAGLYDTRQLFPFYVLGLILSFGLVLGRLVCGLLCPFGFLQDLLGKLSKKKLRPELKHAWLDKRLRYIKYLILLVLVFILPFLGRFIPELMAPWFCKLVCPSGTSLAGWPMVSLNPNLQANLGFIFSWKTSLALAILIAAIFIPRIFCRYLCPLGALYALCNKFALYQLYFQPSACIQCGNCKRVCPMGVDMPIKEQSPECIRCGKCVAACPTNCLSCGFKKPTPVPAQSSSKQTEA